MAERYPDLNEPVRTIIGRFLVVALNTGEFVQCPVCLAVVCKDKAKAHTSWHARIEVR